MKHGTQKWLAEKAGISTRHINNIVLGKIVASRHLSLLLEHLTGIKYDIWRNPKTLGLRDALEEKYPK